MSQQEPFGDPQSTPPAGYQGGQPMGHPDGKPKSNTLKILLIVGGVLGLLSLVCCGGCLYMANSVGEMASGIITTQVENQYGSHPTIVEQIGDDAEFSFSIVGAGNDPDAADGKLPVKVSGSNGSGKLLVRQAGNDFVDAVLLMDDGTEFPLDDSLEPEEPVELDLPSDVFGE